MWPFDKYLRLQFDLSGIKIRTFYVSKMTAMFFAIIIYNKKFVHVVILSWNSPLTE